jgi:hypothetical protein
MPKASLRSRAIAASATNEMMLMPEPERLYVIATPGWTRDAPILRRAGCGADDGKDSAQAVADLRAAVPSSHLAFLASLRISITVEDTSCAMPAFAPASRWSARPSRTSYGSATRFVRAAPISERLWCMATLRPKRRRCFPTGSVSTPAHS